MTKKYKYRWVIIGILICFLLFIFSFKIIPKSYFQASFIKEISKFPGGKDFIKSNPQFISSIIDCPEILIILKNSIFRSPKFIEFFFQHYKEVIKDFKDYPEIRKIFLNLSSHHIAIEQVTEYNRVVSFYKKNPTVRKRLMRRPDFARYIVVEQPEKAKMIMESPEPRKTGQKIYEEFIIEKYLKQPQK